MRLPLAFACVAACSQGGDSRAPARPPAVRLVGCATASPGPSRPAPLPTEAVLARVPHMRFGTPTVSGALDKVIVRRSIRERAPALQACYEKQLAAKPALAGMIDVALVIAGSGKVASAEATGVDPEVASCVAGVFRAIEFPRSPDGLAVQVAQQLAFKATEELPAASTAPIPWTPYARRATADDPIARVRVSDAIERMLPEIDACFTTVKGSLRAMIALSRVVDVRIGGLGDIHVEECVRTLLRRIDVPPADVELACDLESGGPAPWRISTTTYESVAVSRNGPALPETPRRDTSYAIVADRDATGDAIEQAVRWAAGAPIIALAVNSDGGRPIFVGLAPSAALEVETSAPIGFTARGGVVSTCTAIGDAKPATIADPHALDALFAIVKSACRGCTLAFATVPEITAKELVALASAARRNGLDRFRIGGVACP